MDSLYNFSIVAPNNDETPPDGFPENVQFSTINDTFRELMAVLSRDRRDIGQRQRTVVVELNIATISGSDLIYEPLQTLPDDTGVTVGLNIDISSDVESTSVAHYNDLPVRSATGGYMREGAFQRRRNYVLVRNHFLGGWQLLSRMDRVPEDEHGRSFGYRDVVITSEDLTYTDVGTMVVADLDALGSVNLGIAEDDLIRWPLRVPVDIVAVNANADAELLLVVPEGHSLRQFTTDRQRPFVGATEGVNLNTTRAVQSKPNTYAVLKTAQRAGLFRLIRTGLSSWVIVEGPLN
jgi:hypothetical protein